MNEKTPASILKQILEKRCEKNSRYSLRSFARDLEISPQTLSRILRQKRGLSYEMGVKISQKLPLSEQELIVFLNLIEANFSRSKNKRENARKKLSSHHAHQEDKQLPLESKEIISRQVVVDPEDFPQVKEYLLTVLNEFEGKFSGNVKEKKTIYQLSIQCRPIESAID